jgi:two-component system sensor histidine kinase/response regulator
MVPDYLSLLKAVFESTADGILIVDNEGKVVLYNHRFEILWSIPQEIAKTKNDKTLLEFILNQLVDPDQFILRVNDLYKDKEASSKDFIEFKDGRVLERFSRPLKIENVTAGRYWSFRDVTQHKKDQEVLAAITDLSPDIISIINPEGFLTFNSAASERIHGYAKDELLGLNTIDKVHEDDREGIALTMERILKNPNSQESVQYRYLNKDGSYSWMEATASNQCHNPLIKGIVTISREISERKKLEHDLNSALRLRDEFTSIASHELKTPITSILLKLQMLQRKRKGMTPTAPSENIDGLIEQVNSLQRLIDDLLSVSKIRSDKLVFEMEDLDLSKMLCTCVERLTELFASADCMLNIDVKENVRVKGDKLRLGQVINNVLMNAIKYAPGTLVEVSLKTEGDFAVIRVRDHGPGIPAEKHKAIFGLFERANCESYVSGLGIGLFIARSIVHEHHGSIEIEPEITKGTSFLIRLPMI